MRGGLRAQCSDKCREEYKVKYSHERHRKGKPYEVSGKCIICGTPFRFIRKSGARPNVCSDYCKKKRANLRSRESQTRHMEKTRKRRRTYCQSRRAVKMKAFRESWSSDEILERDGWMCHICGGKIEKGLSFPDRMHFAMDHVLPLSMGGDDAPWNVAAVHAVCNSRKGATFSDEDRALSEKLLEQYGRVGAR